jgi:hypothetical protein
MDASKDFGEIGHMGAVNRRCPETKFPISSGKAAVLP